MLVVIAKEMTRPNSHGENQGVGERNNALRAIQGDCPEHEKRENEHLP
jgi:hypothetical protein